MASLHSANEYGEGAPFVCERNAAQRLLSGRLARGAVDEMTQEETAHGQEAGLNAAWL